MIVIDVETQWSRDADELEAAHPLPEVPPPVPDAASLTFGNVKNPELLAAKQAEKHAKLVADREEAIAKAVRERDAAIRKAWQSSSLDALRGSTLCVGIARDDREPTCIWGDTERDTLAALESGLRAYHDRVIVTWNGLNFDLPFLARRALRYGLHGLARRLYFPRPYGNRGAIDLYRVWSMAERIPRGRLNEVARHLGIEVDPTLDGASVPRLWHEAITAEDRALARQQITDHVTEDVRVTREVARIFELAGWLDERLAVEQATRDARGGDAA